MYEEQLKNQNLVWIPGLEDRYATDERGFVFSAIYPGYSGILKCLRPQQLDCGTGNLLRTADGKVKSCAREDNKKIWRSSQSFLNQDENLSVEDKERAEITFEPIHPQTIQENFKPGNVIPALRHFSSTTKEQRFYSLKQEMKRIQEVVDLKELKWLPRCEYVVAVNKVGKLYHIYKTTIQDYDPLKSNRFSCISPSELQKLDHIAYETILSAFGSCPIDAELLKNYYNWGITSKEDTFVVIRSKNNDVSVMSTQHPTQEAAEASAKLSAKFDDFKAGDIFNYTIVKVVKTIHAKVEPTVVFHE